MNYYRMESKQFVAENSVVEYMKKVCFELWRDARVYFTNDTTGRDASCRRGRSSKIVLASGNYESLDEDMSKGPDSGTFYTTARGVPKPSRQ